MFGGETETQFLNNLETTEKNNNINFDAIEYFYQHEFFISDKNMMHHRKVYGSLEFLGDIGGITEAMFTIGYLIHFFIS